MRQLRLSVRMFVAAELRDWTRAAGFARADCFGPDAEPLTAASRRMITIAQR